MLEEFHSDNYDYNMREVEEKYYATPIANAEICKKKPL